MQFREHIREFPSLISEYRRAVAVAGAVGMVVYGGWTGFEARSARTGELAEEYRAAARCRSKEQIGQPCTEDEKLSKDIVKDNELTAFIGDMYLVLGQALLENMADDGPEGP